MTSLTAASHPVLLLLHGLGANGAVWHDVVELARAAGWRDILAPDLAGHGGGARHPDYTFATKARALADHLDPARRYVILGHSLGGAVAVQLADAAYGLSVDRVIAVGVKAGWTEDEVAIAARLAQKPQAMFETRDEAIERYLKVTGLYGLVPHEHPSVQQGVTNTDDGRWHTTVDPRTVGAGKPEMARLIAASTAPVLLARGAEDPVCTEDMLAELEAELGLPPHVTLPGLGHNPHVQDPAAVVGLLPG